MRAKIRPLNTNLSPTNRRLSTVLLSCLATLVLLLMPMSFGTVTTAQKSADTAASVPTVVIYDNGPFATGATSRSGVAAPAGTQWSEASYDYGITTVANTLAGVGCQRIGATTNNRCADDFNVPVGQTWTVNTITTYVYQSGFAGLTSPVIAANCQIWNGRPGNAGATVIAGNATSLPFTSVDSATFRIFNSGPPLNTATGTTRRVWATTVTFAAPVVLAAGNYWVDFQTDAGAGGNFSPPVTITGTRGVPGWTARQSINGGVAWADSFDDGTPATASNIIQEFPFKLDGTVAFADGSSPNGRRMDFDGDNKSDAVVARATGVAAQTTWYVAKSTGGSTATDWGLGVGFAGAGGDVPTPEDFDGDGKTDIAVWRPHPTAASFFILLSSNGTLRTEQFGKTGDDATVIDDYDGDGKADVAVFRSTVTAIDPCGTGAVWYWRPSGTPATNFAYACWGIAGDRPYPGDFDGDGRADPSVVRNNGGNADIYQNRTTAGVRTVSFGSFTTDSFIAGDFDADGRADLAITRDQAGSRLWYFTSSGNGQSFTFLLGNSATDFTVPGDYDGDNKTDFALWRSGTGTGSGDFYLLKSNSSPAEFKWGNSGGNLAAPDFPVGAYQVH